MIKKGSGKMKVVSELKFIEAKMKMKRDGSGDYPVCVFYDSSSETVIKPFVQEASLKQLQMLKPYQAVNVEMDVYQGRSGMTCSLIKVVTI